MAHEMTLSFPNAHESIEDMWVERDPAGGFIIVATTKAAPERDEPQSFKLVWGRAPDASTA